MIIVTGGAGFIGSAIVWKLNSEGIDDIILVDELGTSDKWKNLVNLRYNDYIHKDDFLDMVLEDDVPFPVSGIIHMGACSSTTERDADYLMENNYRYSVNLADWAVKRDIRFIYASSAATYGDGSSGFSDDTDVAAALKPINMYGYSKQLFDLWVIRNELEAKTVGIKFFNVFGPNEYHKGDMRSVIHKSFGQIGETGKVRLFKSHRPEYGDGEQERDFVYVQDCVDVLWWLFENREVNGIFNLGTGKARTWNDLVKAVYSAAGRDPDIEYVDMPESIRDQYQYFTEARMDKLRLAGCPLSFHSLEDAISDYVKNYLAGGEKCLG
jgi:ADP-L-glycero-D-manno-heptose 6-epimerase